MSNTTSSALEATIRRYYEGCNLADVEMMMETMAPEAVHYFPAGAPQGPFRSAREITEGWVSAVERLGSIWTIESVLVDADKREAAVEWTHWKTKLGVYLRGDEWYQFDAAGRITEIRAYYACPPANPGQSCEMGGFDYLSRGYSVEPPARPRRRQGE